MKGKRFRWAAQRTTEQLVELETENEEAALAMIQRGDVDVVREMDLGWDLDLIGEVDDDE